MRRQGGVVDRATRAFGFRSTEPLTQAYDEVVPAAQAINAAVRISLQSRAQQVGGERIALCSFAMPMAGS